MATKDQNSSGNSSGTSPLAVAFPPLPQLQGLKLKTYAAGLRYHGRDDLCALVFDSAATMAGTFTSNRTAGAPIDWNRALTAKSAKARAIIINAGNANVFTGRAGCEMCEATATAAAQHLNCAAEQIWLASTGVIGEKTHKDYIARHIEELLHAPDKAHDKNWLAAAQAIGTTDTFPKGAYAEIAVAGGTITIAGIAKGSGMIAPDLATMLSFIVTDAAVPQALLQKALAAAVETSFNCVTVDSDTSTSDMVLLASLGTAQAQAIDEATYEAFAAALTQVAKALAKSLAADGEGAKKFITVHVKGATDNKSARQVALSIGNSPLVKTAIAGEDANWGRVVMAVGKSGAQVERDKLDIDFGSFAVARQGAAVADYDEVPIAAYMGEQYIDIHVNLNIGNGTAEIWTCDLTYDYIRINADYRS